MWFTCDLCQAFLIIMICGIASSFLVLPPNLIVRGDGTIPKLDTSTQIHEELIEMLRLLKDWRMLALMPMFFASNYFYAYQGSVNATVFDGPTRALNATLEGAGAIVGALLIGYLVFDNKWLSRRNRGYLGLAVVTVITIIVWAVGLAWQVTFERDYKDVHGGRLLNYHDSNYKGKGALYFFCESDSIFHFISRINPASPRLFRRCMLPSSRVLDHECTH